MTLEFRFCPTCGRRGWTGSRVCPHCVDPDTPLRKAGEPQRCPCCRAVMTGRTERGGVYCVDCEDPIEPRPKGREEEDRDDTL